MPRLTCHLDGILLTIAALAAAVAPLATPRDTAAASVADAFPGFPARFEGRDLTALPLTAREAAFAEGFPGRIGRFSDGRREILLRWVATPTRKLHPAADCLEAAGYRITPLPLQRAADGRAMSCQAARQDGRTLRVCELVTAESGESWSDVQAWYWSTLLARRPPAVWSVVIAEQISDTDVPPRP